MTENNGRFVQIHALVSYPPSNLNRDDMGRPKTAVMGGKPRLRISSQSMKRAWRESEFFSDALSGHVGYRTRKLGIYVKEALTGGLRLSTHLKEKSLKEKSPKEYEPLDEEMATEWALSISKVFYENPKKKNNKDNNQDNTKDKSNKKKTKEDDKLTRSQLIHLSNLEVQEIDSKLLEIARNRESPEQPCDQSSFVLKKISDVDIALFGRMLTAAPDKNIDAAAQVAHPITIHPVVVEDDYFTAVDDLNSHEEDAGAAHLGVNEYGAGVFYTYVCVNRELLIENLGDDVELANRAIGALVECVAKVGPKGKQNSYASRAYASYLMVEQGSQQPRSLAAAFLGPMSGNNYLLDGISRLEMECQALDTAYGLCADGRCVLNVPEGKGTLQDILKFVSGKDA